MKVQNEEILRDESMMIYEGDFGIVLSLNYRQRLEEFMSGFSFISLKLKEMYQMITLGKFNFHPRCLYLICL